MRTGGIWKDTDLGMWAMEWLLSTWLAPSYVEQRLKNLLGLKNARLWLGTMELK